MVDENIVQLTCLSGTIDHATLFAWRGTFLSPLLVDGPELCMGILIEVVCVCVNGKFMLVYL